MTMVEAAEARDAISGQAIDPILECVRFLARSWRKSDSPATLTAGLPLVDGRLTSDLIEPAFARVGISVRKIEARPAQLKQFDYPALVFRDGQSPLVLLGRAGWRKFLAYDPVRQIETHVDYGQVGARQRRPMLVAFPNYDNVQESSGKRFASRGHWFWGVTSGHVTSIWYVLLAAAFINVFALAFPLFTMNVYDRVLPNAAQATLWVLAIGVLGVSLFDLLLKLARSAVIEFVGRSIDFRLSSALFDRVLNTPMSQRPESTGAFVSRVGQYEVLREFVAASTLVMFVDVLFLGVFAYIIASLVGWLVVFPLVAGFISIVVTLIVGTMSGRAVKSALAESSARNSVLVEALSAAQSVKAARAEGQLLRRWEAAVLASSRTQDKIRQLQAVASNITATLSQLSLICIIVAGSYFFADGQVTMGAIIAAMMLSNRLIAPIAMIAATLLRARTAMEAYRTVDQIMSLDDERPSQFSNVQRIVRKGRITLDKVRFAYPRSKVFVLDGISLTIEPGEKVGIIGRIGSGKTTIGRLLVNFYRPGEGQITIDGIDIDQYHPDDLRRSVGLVVQDPEIFSGTVRDNIVLSDPGASEQRFMQAAKRAGVEDFVAKHPLGYDMPVGERGVLLSGGQRQAIALARAILVEPKILFLDEPSSSMDLATENQLIKHLKNSLGPEQTVLIATHRHSLLSLVERLMVIENGRLIADGPKDKVLEQLRARGQSA
ncbi:type I secretion system permease/ATPase [Devosia sp. SL43]|uniref:type I secretion system permease/ATPase n=1 Tax=Devosia sp. SL43 TaxID=2806348 RepID=UPI001F019382|nr:type I secretion system permease/ATPase [Devosia sp. SL43]UJW83976.1 type I secretion system permease/ATPase [Devosia sp. SL43]